MATAAKKAAPVKKVEPVKKPTPAKKAAAPRMAPAPTFKPRKGETLEYNRRNGTVGTGKFAESVMKGKGQWYILKVEGGRNPTAFVRPSEVRRPTN